MIDIICILHIRSYGNEKDIRNIATYKLNLAFVIKQQEAKWFEQGRNEGM